MGWRPVKRHQLLWEFEELERFCSQRWPLDKCWGRGVALLEQECRGSSTVLHCCPLLASAELAGWKTGLGLGL